MFILTQFLLVFSQEITWTNYSFAFPQFIPLIADKTVFSRTFEDFGQILNISIEYNGDYEESICNFEYQSIVFRKHPETLIALINDMQYVDIDNLKTEDIEQGFSEEIISYTIKNRDVILLEKNGTIYHLQYNVVPKLANYTTHQLQIIQDGYENQIVLADNDSYYYVDQHQLIQFTIKNDTLEQFKILNWKKVNGHFKFFVREQLFYLINGNQGLTVYKVLNNVLIKINEYDIEIFSKSFSNTKLNLVDYALEDDFLYLLDQENGVYRLNVTSMNLDRKFFIAQKGCKVISVRNKQIILIQQNQLFSEVYEGRIIDDGWVIIRMRTISKLIIRNIYQFNNFALLISNPTNNVYQKSLIDSLTDPSLIKGDNFYQMELLGVSELDENFVIGIYRYGVAIYFKQERSAQITCQARLSQQNRVTIRLNSTNCLNKNQSDAFNYCQSRLDYVFDIHGVLMSSQQEDLYIYLCVVAFSIVVGLFLAIFFIIRRYQMKKEMIYNLRKSRRSLSY
ncbi:unnamed protein product [Paramecium sonneborni]|uniref:Transmembrane protein n=1 Tax=Paramecium sonneborni TaxID=65129 RepID=A0A8S1R8I8_9CILI|nr:unnamed protein product [Paramecium sonneborni]